MGRLRFRKSAGALLALSALVWLSGCGRPRSEEDGPALSGEGHLAIVDLRNGVSELTTGGGFLPRPATETFTGLLRGLSKLEKDESTAGIFVRLGGQTLSLSRSTEIAEHLAQLRKAKKRVTCYTHEIDNSTAVLVLQGCDEVWLSAAGEVSTVGIAAQITYFKGAMDQLGVQADMLAMGRFKSGAESLTREGPSETAAENLTHTLGDLRQVWLDAATKSLGPKAEGLRKALEDGPHTPPRASELGLVTRVGYEDEAIAAAKKAAGTSNTEVVFGPGAGSTAQSGGAGRVLRTLLGAEKRSKGRPHIAVVPMVGSITVSAGGPFSDGGITSDEYVKLIRSLRDDDSVKALVVRIDSPGGSPLASDLIWHQLMLTRQKKPVVVSVAGMAASGGYYIASAADHIVASPGAIVGSIGVFGGKIVIGGALAKFGIKSHDFPANPEPVQGARALQMSPLTAWDDATRERVRQTMQRIYDLFVERVAEGRKLPKDKIYATAEGEIFLSALGKERGLVDELGGLDRSIEVARSRAKLGADAPITVEGGGNSFLEALLGGGDGGEDELESALGRWEEARRRAQASVPEVLLARELRPFAGVLGPLWAGESVVAALPWSIDVH
jgi:protease-4